MSEPGCPDAYVIEFLTWKYYTEIFLLSEKDTCGTQGYVQIIRSEQSASRIRRFLPRHHRAPTWWFDKFPFNSAICLLTINNDYCIKVFMMAHQRSSS